MLWCKNCRCWNCVKWMGYLCSYKCEFHVQSDYKITPIISKHTSCGILKDISYNLLLCAWWKNGHASQWRFSFICAEKLQLEVYNVEIYHCFQWYMNLFFSAHMVQHWRVAWIIFKAFLSTCHHSMVFPQVLDGADGLQICKVAMNIE
jgi:hypothetical protein